MEDRNGNLSPEASSSWKSTGSHNETAAGIKSGWRKAFNVVENIAFACILLIMVVLVYSMVQSRLSGTERPSVRHRCILSSAAA